MNSFEKAVIGVARTDQALNKAQNIVGIVTFGVAVVGIGVFFLVIRHSINKSNEAKLKADADKKTASELAGKNTEVIYSQVVKTI